MAECFVYGTLMNSEIYSRVVYGEPSIPNTAPEVFQPATLPNYRRHCVKNQCYPGVYQNQGEEVRGILVSNVTTKGLEKLDDFELDEYERKTLNVFTADGQKHDAYVYVWLDRGKLEDTVWDYDEQVRNGLVADVIAKYL